jgi:two-component system response regulator YesN
MLKILVVDDEPYILDGIAELLEAEEKWAVEKAPSGSRAMAKLEAGRADIVLTDIRMPGVDGMALFKEIRERWPFCKVIFLTAHGDFDYAREALSHGAFGYLLKTDGDAVILAEVRRCEELILEEMRRRNFEEESKRKANSAGSLLKNAALLNIMEWMPCELAIRELEEHGMVLDLEAEMLLAVTHIDKFLPGSNSHQRFQTMVQVEEILAAYLSPRFYCFHASQADKNVIWLLQEKERGDKNLVYLKQMLEMAQENVRQALGLSVSIVYDKTIPFSQLHERYRHMLSILTCIVIQGEDGVLANSQFFSSRGAKEALDGETSPVMGLEALRGALAAADQAAVEADLKRLLYSRKNQTTTGKLAAYHAICGVFLEYIENIGLEEQAFISPEWVDIFYRYNGRSELLRSLSALAPALMEAGRQLQSGRSAALIQAINNHIKANLSGDLSLQAVADVFYMNPSYLTRFYRQHTGVPLGEAIAAKRMQLAKRMLGYGEIKIAQIAKDTGYDSAAYFSRLFKKREGVTPQEWRESH